MLTPDKFKDKRAVAVSRGDRAVFLDLARLWQYLLSDVEKYWVYPEIYRFISKNKSSCKIYFGENIH